MVVAVSKVFKHNTQVIAKDFANYTIYTRVFRKTQ